MKPGITGWAQINGGRNVAAPEKGLLDEWYVSHVSIWLDLYIIARTIGAVLFGDSRKASYPMVALKTGKLDRGTGLIATLAPWMRGECTPKDATDVELASSVNFAEFGRFFGVDCASIATVRWFGRL